MDVVTGVFLGTLAVVVILFLIFRELICWYWKINQRLATQYKTNFLLEKLSIQLGATESDTITIEEIKTGKKSQMKIDKWIEYVVEQPKNAARYRRVKE